jgi:hypothetical protein
MYRFPRKMDPKGDGTVFKRGNTKHSSCSPVESENKSPTLATDLNSAIAVMQGNNSSAFYLQVFNSLVPDRFPQSPMKFSTF